MPASVALQNPTTHPAGSSRTNSAAPQTGARAPRSRTPPDLKWLVNERASVHGAIRTQEVKLVELEAKQATLLRQLARVNRDSLAAGAATERLRANLQALDTSIALVHQGVNPSCLGSVQAWAGRYGERGALQAFVRETLKACAPSALTMTVLLDLAAQNFGQVFSVPNERRSFRKSVRSALRALHVRELIEPLHEGTGSEHGQWRWKAPVSSLEALQQQGKSQGLSWR